MSIRGTYIRGYSRPVAPNPAPLLRPAQVVPGWDGRRVPLTLAELSTAAAVLWSYQSRTTDFTKDCTDDVGLGWILSGVASTLLDPQNRSTLVQLTLARHFKIRPCYRVGMSRPMYPVEYLGYRMIRFADRSLSPLDIGALMMHLPEVRANFPTLFPSPDR